MRTFDCSRKCKWSISWDIPLIPEMYRVFNTQSLLPADPAAWGWDPGALNTPNVQQPSAGSVPPGPARAPCAATQLSPASKAASELGRCLPPAAQAELLLVRAVPSPVRTDLHLLCCGCCNLSIKFCIAEATAFWLWAGGDEWCGGGKKQVPIKTL